jgi:hypothetical protein
MTVQAAAEPEPPSRVGRVSLAQGDVSFYMDREEGWRKAQLNFPVTSENSLSTGINSRAEVRIGASALRISDDSVIDFVRVDDEQMQTFLQRGTLNLRLRADDNAERSGGSDPVRVETAGGQFSFSASGRYRIDVSPESAETRVSVFSGRARFESRDNRLSIEVGKSLIVRGVTSTNDFRFEQAAETSFDLWALARDQAWDQTHTRYVQQQLVSPYMTGYEDLDGYGDWIDDGEYGRLWTPRVVVSGWAPYRYGHWAYVRPWGWSWIDDAAWGFAPFHYGRWVQVRSRWAWWPGAYVRRPVYAPALVAWFNRPGVNISIATGPSVGWFPLAPREHFLPGYSTNATYIRNINHITDHGVAIRPPLRYVNQLPGATVVLNNVFHGGQHVGRNIARVPPSVIAAQSPGTGTDFGPRYIRRGGTANAPRDPSIDDRPPRGTQLPTSPLPPVQGNPRPTFNSPQPYNKPAAVPASGGALPVVTDTKAAPRLDDRQPIPRGRGAPANAQNSDPSASIGDRVQTNPLPQRRDRPVIDRAPAQPSSPVVVNPSPRVVPPVRAQQDAGEARSTPKPQNWREREGKPVPAPEAKPAPVNEPKSEGRNKQREPEREAR